MVTLLAITLTLCVTDRALLDTLAQKGEVMLCYRNPNVIWYLNHKFRALKLDPGEGYCFLFLGKTLCFYNASF